MVVVIVIAVAESVCSNTLLSLYMKQSQWPLGSNDNKTWICTTVALLQLCTGGYACLLRGFFSVALALNEGHMPAVAGLL